MNSLTQHTVHLLPHMQRSVAVAEIITSADDIRCTAANKFGTYYHKTTQDYTYYNIYLFSCCRPIPRIEMVVYEFS